MRLAQVLLMTVALGLGVGGAVLAAGAGADSASTPRWSSISTRW
jgi:hypothetical protein